MAQAKVKPIPEGMHSLTPHIVCDGAAEAIEFYKNCLLYTSPSPRDGLLSRMPSSA